MTRPTPGRGAAYREVYNGAFRDAIYDISGCVKLIASPVLLGLAPLIPTPARSCRATLRFRLDIIPVPFHLLWLCMGCRVFERDGGGQGQWQIRSRFVCVFTTDASMAPRRRRYSIASSATAFRPALNSILRG